VFSVHSVVKRFAVLSFFLRPSGRRKRDAGQQNLHIQEMTSKIFLDKSRYYLGTEYPQKIRLATKSLSHDDVWRRANEQSNSIGNLMLHLAGNIRHWIVSGIGGAPSTRDRAAEFAATDGADIRGSL
jgi:hypothetical protein